MAGTRKHCEYADKIAFSSKHDARSALTGQLKSKRVRVYPCPANPAHYHVTKEGSTRLT